MIMNIWCFLKRFFAQNNSNMIKESFFACFFEFEFLTQTDYFAKAKYFQNRFQNRLISPIVGVFSSDFFTEQL